MAEKPYNIFLSYSGEDAFEANLLQFAFEELMKDKEIKLWTYQRDQNKAERDVSKSLKERVRESRAVIFLLSPSTLNNGATQWMELAYSDAFEIPTFILLHRLTYQELKNRERGVPPLLLKSQCNQAIAWRSIERELRKIIGVENG